jgi:hypothetical protein
MGLFALPMFAQTARVQAIHNSADAAAETVDVYLTTTSGSVLLIDDFTFRNATPFIDAPAGEEITLSIAPGTSTSVADTITGLSNTYTLTEGETYVLIAEGIVSASGYSPNIPFSIQVYGMGREAATTSGNTDVLVHHGSTDAPTVDVRERNAGTIVDDISYGEYQGYLELATADYILDVQTSDGAITVASYLAPLSTLNLEDSALIVVASGFLDPAANSDGPAFGLYVALPTGGELIALPSSDGPTAKVQVIHNSADAAAAVVDVYVDGVLALDDFAFRTASPFVDLPATQNIQVAIAPSNSMSVADSIPGAVFNYNLAINETYILIADGIVSATGYDPSPAFDIIVYGMGQETAMEFGNTDVLVHHGSTDAPTVDVRERNVGTIVNDISYGDYQGYLELPTSDYILDVQNSDGTITVASYSAPLETLMLQDAAIVVVASGFLDPSNNSDGPAFGLYVALPAGGALVALPTTDGPTARAQVIHNSADAAAEMVDVYLDGALLLNDFTFRTATPFVDLPATKNIQVAIAPSNSMSVADSIPGAVFNYNLAINETYILVADGIVSPTGYSPSPAFDIYVYGLGREMATEATNTDVLIHHGSTDAPAVDVEAVGAGTLVDNLAYTDFAGYLELATADYTLNINDETGSTTLFTYSAPLSTLSLDGAAIVVVASGFVDPSQNSDGSGFGLFVALASGGDLVALPEVALSVSDIEKVAVSLYPNPTMDVLRINDLNLNEYTISIIDITGRVVNSNLFGVQNNLIDVSGLVRGTYQLMLISEGDIVGNTKFVKL